MEDKLLVAKTLLKCYPHLDDLYEALTESTRSCVASGFYALYPIEQMRLYERINEYENRKLGLYNMKYLINQSLQNGRSVSVSLLKEKFINHLSMKDLMEKYCVCMRTCYRYLIKGLADFASEMEKLGYDKKKVLIEFGNEPLFQTMLTRVIKEDDAEIREESNRKREEVSPHRRHPYYFCYGSFSEGGRARRE